MDIRIPKLGVAMTEGTLVEWLVADGEQVELGTSLYRLETEKVENEIESPAMGTIHLLVDAGDLYPVGTTVARVDEQ
jgi:pyruvate/2-oxoglutarate dehydrogenase complex dihydrolipoamide acyltransferase (E2) component